MPSRLVAQVAEPPPSRKIASTTPCAYRNEISSSIVMPTEYGLWRPSAKKVTTVPSALMPMQLRGMRSGFPL